MSGSKVTKQTLTLVIGENYDCGYDTTMTYQSSYPLCQKMHVCIKLNNIIIKLLWQIAFINVSTNCCTHQIIYT